MGKILQNGYLFKRQPPLNPRSTELTPKPEGDLKSGFRDYTRFSKCALGVESNFKPLQGLGMDRNHNNLLETKTI